MRFAILLMMLVAVGCGGNKSNPGTGSMPVGQDVSPQGVPSLSAESSIDEYYRPNEVQSVYLTVDNAELERLTAALPERIYVKASFRWRDVTVENVAIRFKGNSSSQPMQQHKRGYLVKFNEYEKDQEFLGLRRVSFDNGVQFGSLFSEPIITEIMRVEELPAHRCNYAKLYVNDEYQGVYVNVERIDEIFVTNHLPDPHGFLFKVDEGGPGSNLQFLGDDASVYDRAFEAENKLSKAGRLELVKFIKLIQQTPEQEFAAQLEKILELDDFLETTAILLLAGAFDQLTGWNPHNYYLYYDTKAERWRYLPWDLDVGFCEVAFGKIRVIEDWNAAWPTAGQMPNPLIDRIVADPELLKRYRDQARVILDKHFEPERLCTAIDAKYALIKQDLATDPYPARRATVPSDRNYDDIVASQKEFVRKRYATALAQLTNPGPRPEMVRRPEGSQSRIPEMVQRVLRGAEAMQRKGQDVSPIQKLMQQVGPLLQQGRAAEAEELIQEALKLVEVGDAKTK